MVEGSWTGIGPGSRGVTCPRCSGRGRRCGSGIAGWQATARGTGPRRGDSVRGPGWGGGSVVVSGLHDRSRASARHEHRPHHRGNHRITRIRDSSRLITDSGRSRGGLSTKVHQLVDGHGLPLVTLITPGQAGDSPMLLPLLAALEVARPVGRPRTRPDRLRGDKAYSSKAIRQHLRDRGIESVIPEPRGQQGRRKTAWFPRRETRDLRPHRLQEPERRRAWLLSPQAMASPGDEVRRPRDRLPLSRRAQRRHRLDPPFRRHALDPSRSAHRPRSTQEQEP